MIPSAPFLCVITDELHCPVTLAEEALLGGAAIIQLRHKSATGSQLFTWAVEITRLCKKYRALSIINDRVDIALACGADGVHLGQNDMPLPSARQLLGSSRVIGVSASSVEEAVQAEKDGADYIGFGHIFPTVSKQKGFAPVGIEALASVASFISLPIVAIGGISIDNASLLIEKGASAVAVISAVSRAVKPEQATRELVYAINKGS
jgi:thiamine-phosphate pyrophosphorylase